MTEAGRVTAVIDGDISALTSKLAQARSQASTAASGIEADMKSKLGGGMSGVGDNLAKSLGGGGKFKNVGAALGSEMMGGLNSSLGAVGGVASALGPIGIAVGVVGAGLAASVSAAASWETAMAGVAKTTGLAGADLSTLSASLLEMSTNMPVAASELANIAGVAGSLGVAKENIAGFTAVAAQMAVAFQMPADAAATAGAKILNAFGKPIDAGNMEAFGNVINSMGDNFAATESQVMDFTNRASFLGTAMGQTIPQVAALGTVLISAGMESEVAASGVQALLTAMNNTATAGKGMDALSQLMGKPAEALKQSMGDDLNGTISAVAEKLAQIQDPVERFNAAVAIGGDQGARVLLKMAGQADTLTGALSKANSEWANGTSLQNTFATQSATVDSEWQMLSNTMTKAGTELGTVLLPVIAEGISSLNDMAKAGIAVGESLASAARKGADLLGQGAEAGVSAGQGLSGWLNDITGGALGYDEMAETASSAAAMAGQTSATTYVDEWGNTFDTSDYKNFLKEKTVEAGKEAGAEGGTASAEEFAAAQEAYIKSHSSGGYSLATMRMMASQQTKSDLSDKILGEVEIGGGVFARINYDINDQYTGYKLTTPTGEYNYASYQDFINSAPRDLEEYVGRPLTELEKAEFLGDTQKVIQLNSMIEVEVDTYLNFAENLEEEMAGAGEEINSAFLDGMTPDKASIESRLKAIRELKLYDPAEAKRQGADNAIAYLSAVKDALESLDKAKLALQLDPENENLQDDLNQSLANAQGILNQNPLSVKVEIDSGGLEADFSAWLPTQKDLIEKQASLGQAPMRSDYEQQYKYLQSIENGANENSEEIKIRLETIREAAASGNPDQLAAAYDAAKRLAVIAPELSRQTWYNSQLLTIDRELATLFAVQDGHLVYYGDDTKLKFADTVVLLEAISNGITNIQPSTTTINNNWYSSPSTAYPSFNAWDYMNPVATPGSVQTFTKDTLMNALASKNYAGGGFADRAMYVFGEAGREALVPIANRAAGLAMLPQVLQELGVRQFAAGGLTMSSSLASWGGQPGASSGTIYYDAYGNIIDPSTSRAASAQWRDCTTGACLLQDATAKRISSDQLDTSAKTLETWENWISPLTNLDTENAIMNLQTGQDWISSAGEDFFDYIHSSAGEIQDATEPLAQAVQKAGTIDIARLGYDAEKEQFFYQPPVSGIDYKNLAMGRVPKEVYNAYKSEYDAATAEIERMNEQLKSAKENYLDCWDVATDYSRWLWQPQQQAALFQGDFIGPTSAYGAWLAGGRVGNVGWSGNAAVLGGFQANEAGRMFRETGDVSGIISASAFGRVSSSIDATGKTIVNAIGENGRQVSDGLDTLGDEWAMAPVAKILSSIQSDLIVGNGAAGKTFNFRQSEFDQVEYGMSQCMDYMSEWAHYQEAILGAPESAGGKGFFKEASLGGYEDISPDWYNWFVSGLNTGQFASARPTQGGTVTDLTTGMTTALNASEMSAALQSSVRAGETTADNTGSLVKEYRDLSGNLIAYQNTMGNMIMAMGMAGSGAMNAAGGFGGQYGSLFGGWYGGGAAGLDAAFGNPAGSSAGWMNAAASSIGGSGAIQWAEGGFTDSPVYGVFGEAGREAFVPISDRAAGLAMLPRVMQELGVGSGYGTYGKLSESKMKTYSTYNPNASVPKRGGVYSVRSGSGHASASQGGGVYTVGRGYGHSAAPTGGISIYSAGSGYGHASSSSESSAVYTEGQGWGHLSSTVIVQGSISSNTELEKILARRDKELIEQINKRYRQAQKR